MLQPPLQASYLRNHAAFPALANHDSMRTLRVCLWLGQAPKQPLWWVVIHTTYCLRIEYLAN